jgi:hypothetical protein
MDKICVFCGQKPEHKNNEHIIPIWLIELTGNPNRIGVFGDKEYMKPESGKRAFSFDSLRFPSCKSCNTKYSELEAYVKPIVQSIITANPISAPEFNLLLDWFDKIRVGLWLGYMYLDKNPMGITPSFHIDQRIRASDRMLVIFKGEGDERGLRFAGCNEPSFCYTPSCFVMTINNYCFMNISIFGLLARRIGFPYISEPFQREDGHIEGKWVTGRNRIMKPILKKRFSIQGTELYQPIFSGVGIKTDIRKKLYDTEYVRNSSMVWDEGIGKVFINSNSGLQEYPMSPSKAWVPGTTYILRRLLFEMQPLVFEWQTYVDDLAPSLEKLPHRIRQQMKRQKRLNKYHNTKVIGSLRERAEELGMPPLTSYASSTHG